MEIQEAWMNCLFPILQNRYVLIVFQVPIQSFKDKPYE